MTKDTSRGDEGHIEGLTAARRATGDGYRRARDRDATGVERASTTGAATGARAVDARERVDARDGG